MTWIAVLLKEALGLSERLNSWLFPRSSASQSWGLFGQLSVSLKSRTCYLLIVLTVYHIHVHFGGFPCSSWSLETQTGQLFLIISISVLHRCIISNTLFFILDASCGIWTKSHWPCKEDLQYLTLKLLISLFIKPTLRFTGWLPEIAAIFPNVDERGSPF